MRVLDYAGGLLHCRCEYKAASGAAIIKFYWVGKAVNAPELCTRGNICTCVAGEGR